MWGKGLLGAGSCRRGHTDGVPWFQWPEDAKAWVLSTCGLQIVAFTLSWSLLKLISLELMMSSNHLILCCPLLLLPFPALESFPVSQSFASGGQSIGVSASASVLSVNIQGWFPLGLGWLAGFAYREIQETFKSLLQHHSSKASVLWFSAFFMVQLSHPFMTTGKTTALILNFKTTLFVEIHVNLMIF